MKKATMLVLAVSLAFSGALLAREKGEWTGWLTDAKCAANGAKAAHKGCAVKCVESGQAIVFVTDDKKVYQLEGADKVKSMVGDNVVLSGSMSGEKITVDSAKKVGE